MMSGSVGSVGEVGCVRSTPTLSVNLDKKNKTSQMTCINIQVLVMY